MRFSSALKIPPIRRLCSLSWPEEIRGRLIRKGGYIAICLMALSLKPANRETGYILTFRRLEDKQHGASWSYTRLRILREVSRPPPEAGHEMIERTGIEAAMSIKWVTTASVEQCQGESHSQDNN